jgi:hypothetical protein
MIQAQHKHTGEIKEFTDQEWKTVSKTGYYTLLGRNVTTTTSSEKTTTTEQPRTTARGIQPIQQKAKGGGCGCGKKK